MSDSNFTRKIRVPIANKVFSLSVNNDEDEEVFNVAKERIQSTMDKFQKKFGLNPDNLYFTTFQLAVELIRAERNNDKQPILDQLSELNQEMDDVLKDNI